MKVFPTTPIMDSSSTNIFTPIIMIKLILKYFFIMSLCNSIIFIYIASLTIKIVSMRFKETRALTPKKQQGKTAFLKEGIYSGLLPSYYRGFDFLPCAGGAHTLAMDII